MKDKKEQKKRVVVYDRLKLRKVVSRHSTWELAEKAANRLGCGDRFGLKESNAKVGGWAEK